MPILIVLTLIIWMMMAIPGMAIAILMMLVHNASLRPDQKPIEMSFTDIVLLTLAGPFGSILAIVAVAKSM